MNIDPINRHATKIATFAIDALVKKAEQATCPRLRRHFLECAAAISDDCRAMTQEWQAASPGKAVA
jgi:hypothetical protein